MVRNYKRKSGKGVFDSGIVQKAVQEVVQNEGKIRTVARDVQVDKMTLTRYVEKFRDGQINEQDILFPKLNTRQISILSLLIFHTKESVKRIFHSSLLTDSVLSLLLLFIYL